MVNDYGIKIGKEGQLFDDSVFSAIQRITENRIAEAAEKAKQTIQDKAPSKTGALRESIQIEGSGDDTRVVSNLRYAFYVEKGYKLGKKHPFYGQPTNFFYSITVKRAVVRILNKILSDMVDLIQ